MSEAFRRPPTRQEGPSPSWPVGGRRKPSDGLPTAFRRPPTGQEGHLPPREVSLPPGGQNPITLEYQIYPPTIDTLVTGMVEPSCRICFEDSNKFSLSRPLESGFLMTFFLITF